MSASTSPSDRELLERIPDDRTELSLQTLYRRHSHQLYGFAYRSLGDRGAADELVQDVFTSIWRHAESYDGRRGSVRAWVYRITRNAIIDRRRRWSVRPGLAAFAEDETDEPGALDDSIERIAQRSQVAAALARLIPEHHEVVRLAYYQ